MQPSKNAEQSVQVIAEELSSNEAEAEAEPEDGDDESGASPTAAVQPSTLELFQALDALRCCLYAGKADDHLHHHVAEIENFLLCLRRLREHRKHRSLNSSQISNV